MHYSQLRRETFTQWCSYGACPLRLYVNLCFRFGWRMVDCLHCTFTPCNYSTMTNDCPALLRGRCHRLAPRVRSTSISFIKVQGIVHSPKTTGAQNIIVCFPDGLLFLWLGHRTHLSEVNNGLFIIVTIFIDNKLVKARCWQWRLRSVDTRREFPVQVCVQT